VRQVQPTTHIAPTGSVSVKKKQLEIQPAPTPIKHSKDRSLKHFAWQFGSFGSNEESSPLLPLAFSGSSPCISK
jgi:hypothetical protein